LGLYTKERSNILLKGLKNILLWEKNIFLKLMEKKRALMAIPDRDYLACFKDWKKRWHTCILSYWDCVLGDEIKLEE